MKNILEGILVKFIALIPIKWRYNLFYFYGYLINKLMEKMTNIKEVVINNYKAYLESKNNIQNINFNSFYSAYFKSKVVQVSDYLIILTASKKELKNKIKIRFKGKELLDNNLNKNKGVIIINPHIGSHSILTTLIAKYLNYDINTLLMTEEVKTFDDLPDFWYSDFLDKFHLIEVGPLCLIEAYDALKRGEIFVIAPEIAGNVIRSNDNYNDFMLDLEKPVDYTLSKYTVQFLNQTVYATIGAIKLSLKTESPVLFVTVEKKGKFDFEIIFKNVEFTKEKTLQENIDKMYQMIEKEILKRPEEWLLWSHFHKLIVNERKK